MSEQITTLEAVAAEYERLGAMATDPEWEDDDLSFPLDVELSVADLKRAMSALASYRQAMAERQ